MRFLNRHPKFDEWERIPDAVENGQSVRLDYDPYSHRTATAYILNEGETTLVTVGVRLPAGKKRKPRFNVLTAFRARTETVNGWVAKRNTADTPDAKQAAPIPVIGGDFRDSIAGIDEEVNALLGKGKPLFQGARGAIRQLDDGRWLVGLFPNKDFSTIVHEIGHFFLEQLSEAAKLDTSSPWVKKSWAALQKAYGFKGLPTGKEWTRVQERFATEFEAYLREGKSRVELGFPLYSIAFNRTICCAGMWGFSEANKFPVSARSGGTGRSVRGRMEGSERGDQREWSDGARF
ncbi:MAG: hypothetical protein LBR94_10065 [Desulfovibrio sp.]|jgi:hypothetical protein|nr:hypothetical protein [Desulfovibrio sp.]